MPTTEANAVTTPPSPVPGGVDRVLSLPETAQLAGIGFSTLKYLIATNRGPRITRPSPGRVGCRVSHFIEWLNERQD
jgi:predicted DNA-binding transcriptional regulator AlpA